MRCLSFLAAVVFLIAPARAASDDLAAAVRSGDLVKARSLLAAGANPNIPSADGRTPLIEAALRGRLDMSRVLLSAGADPNLSSRGEGTPLEIAERQGYTELAAFLRQHGARTSGRSVGDKVCVRPWKGNGYCGIVEAIDRNDYSIRVTQIVGCGHGCTAKPDCSAGKPVGGAAGIHAGETVTAPSVCLTDTGVAQ